MLAMTYRGPKKVRIEEKREPRLEHPNDAIVRVTRAAICGSDLHLYHGLVPDTRVGSTFGHEFTGVVEAVGASVRALAPGDRVVVPFNISCGTCFFCRRELYSACANTNSSAPLCCGIYGYSHTTGGYDGAQAEYVRVPFADVGPMKIPADVDDEDALFLGDIFPTGYQAAEMGQIKEGETVVVFGAGPVGLFAMKSAWLMGAGRVIAVDRWAYRLDFAARYAAVETMDFSEVEDPVSELHRLTDGLGPDVCIDAVGLEADGSAMHTVMGRKLKMAAGSTAALDWCIQAVRRGGRVSIVGVYGPPFNAVAVGTAMNKGLTLRMGQCNVKRYMPHLLEHVRSGRVDAKGIITHRLPLDAVAKGYEMFERKQDGCIKTVLLPPSGGYHA